MTTQRMCELGKVSRAVIYRLEPATQSNPDLDLRDTIQRIALEFPCHGRPRMTAELKRRG
jgi:putative transposase